MDKATTDAFVKKLLEYKAELRTAMRDFDNDRAIQLIDGICQLRVQLATQPLRERIAELEAGPYDEQ